ncbi:MAG: endonuclease MutS2 [Anaerolineae bacterium]|nr:endonuclease MutS2 [Anaerolineae bacterium]
MNSKHLLTLEFPKVLARLATYASFSAGEEKARTLVPAMDLREVRWRLETTSEARALLDAKPDTTLGGAHDVRPQVAAAQRSAVLPPAELLDVRDTLVAAQGLQRTFARLKDQFPLLSVVAARIQPCPEITGEIDRCLDQRGNVRDDASPELARIRREARIAHDRLQDKLQGIIGSPQNAPFLQEALITQRDGRYVIPLKTDFKGRIRGIVHDVSASGATVFVEPLSVVELNNTWRELQLAEEQEIHRILAGLSALVAGCADEIVQNVETLADLDLAFAKAKYADAIDAAAPDLVSIRESSTVRLFGARHPLLDPETVVPIDVVPDGEASARASGEHQPKPSAEPTHVVVITGPNTGGKTVSLKTVGLLTLMAQAGLHIPAEPGSTLSPFEAVYADIGDEQSIEQSLSTFSSHLTNILSFIDEVDGHSLVLLDELGAGTDPAEGAALARALLDHFRERGAMTFVATHYPELKAYAQLTPGVCNASVEFDAETLSPTYKLSIGLPGRSNAFAIAQRLGLPHDLVETARKLVSPDDLHTEDMLADIHRLRLQEAQARDAANVARSEADRLARQLRDRLDAIEEERQEVLAQARGEAATELEALRSEIRALKRRLQAAAAPVGAVSAIEREAEALEEVLSEPEELAPLPVPDIGGRPVRAGDAVWVRPLNAKGRIIGIDGEEAEVQVGPARTRVSRTDLELIAVPPLEPASQGYRAPAGHSPGEQIEVRGCTIEDALEQVDRHLDAASLAGLPWVRVVHGKGTGALRRAVREFLSDHPLVSSYEPGARNEGGEGVTIAKLVQ